MHMSDALVSPPVAIVAGAASLLLLGTAVRKLRRAHRSPAAAGANPVAAPDGARANGSGPATPPAAGFGTAGPDEHLVPLMGVTGAFVFAAQMINFAIPGTGSSGHLIGGILLAALLGPWAALLTLSSVLVIQCLLFADGGFMALGCNILNMAVLSTLVAYPLIFRPLMRPDASPARIMAASLLASVAALELGAVAVTLETEASGITALPIGRFLWFMLPIHLFIGIGEGLATAAVLNVVRRYKPELLAAVRQRTEPTHRRPGKALAAFAGAALLLGASFSWLASSDPDGLEWSVGKVAVAEPEAATDGLHRTAAAIQQRTALMPDYDTTLSGVIGSGAILAIVFGAAYLFRVGQRQP